MPSVSPAQHRWIGWLHSNPEAAARAGMPMAKVNEWLHSDRGSPWRHRDDGGMVDPTSGSIGGITPSPQTMNPNFQALVQRYSALPPEKLQELSVRLGNSPYGQIIRRLLNQKLAMPNNQPDQSQSMTPQSAPTGIPTAARGGGLAVGGNPMGLSMSMASPWWERQEAYASDRPASGFLAGATAGRADSIKTQAPSGAYVLPADVVAGLGEGNSLAGARVVQEMLSTGPHGIPQERGVRGRGPPRPPSINEPRALQAKGGGVHDGNAEGVTPVALSHGEYVITPAEVTQLGGGDVKRGHRILDVFVKHVRKRHIEKLKSLPGPVGAKK